MPDHNPVAFGRARAQSRRMSRWAWLVVCAACGDNLQAPPPDASPDAAPEPDATVCEADVTSDEANCGACEKLCKGGEVCRMSACLCPTGVVPPLVFPTGLEQFFGAGGFTLALAPTLSIAGINGLVFGFDASIPLDTDIDLSTVPLGATPFVGSLVGLDIEGLMIDASYMATAGTIRFTKRCETEVQGRLTNATFNGISGGLLGGGIPMIDPDGCEIHITTLNFHLATEPCPM
jgi:hypothetical protein